MTGVFYVSPQLRGALTETQADALEYITRRTGRVLVPVTTADPMPAFIAAASLGHGPASGGAAPAGRA